MDILSKLGKQSDVGSRNEGQRNPVLKGRTQSLVYFPPSQKSAACENDSKVSRKCPAMVEIVTTKTSNSKKDEDNIFYQSSSLWSPTYKVSDNTQDYDPVFIQEYSKQPFSPTSQWKDKIRDKQRNKSEDVRKKSFDSKNITRESQRRTSKYEQLRIGAESDDPLTMEGIGYESPSATPFCIMKRPTLTGNIKGDSITDEPFITIPFILRLPPERTENDTDMGEVEKENHSPESLSFDAFLSWAAKQAAKQSEPYSDDDEDDENQLNNQLYSVSDCSRQYCPYPLSPITATPFSDTNLSSRRFSSQQENKNEEENQTKQDDEVTIKDSNSSEQAPIEQSPILTRMVSLVDIPIEPGDPIGHSIQCPAVSSNSRAWKRIFSFNGSPARNMKKTTRRDELTVATVSNTRQAKSDTETDVLSKNLVKVKSLNEKSEIKRKSKRSRFLFGSNIEKSTSKKIKRFDVLVTEWNMTGAVAQWETGMSLKLALRQKDVAAVVHARVKLDRVKITRDAQFPVLILENVATNERRGLMLDLYRNPSISTDSLEFLRGVKFRDHDSERVINKLLSSETYFVAAPIKNTENKSLIFVFESPELQDTFFKLILLLQTYSAEVKPLTERIWK